MTKTMTATIEVTPILTHINALQKEIKRLTADLEQHKALLKNDYMTDIDQIISLDGLVLAKWIERPMPTFDKKKFELEYPVLYKDYAGVAVQRFIQVA